LRVTDAAEPDRRGGSAFVTLPDELTTFIGRPAAAHFAQVAALGPKISRQTGS
jgi:hypothetical protein